jgi:hypothetical protein
LEPHRPFRACQQGSAPSPEVTTRTTPLHPTAAAGRTSCVEATRATAHVSRNPLDEPRYKVECDANAQSLAPDRRLDVVWAQIGTHVPGVVMINTLWVSVIVRFLAATLLILSAIHTWHRVMP